MMEILLIYHVYKLNIISITLAHPYLINVYQIPLACTSCELNILQLM